MYNLSQMKGRDYNASKVLSFVQLFAAGAAWLPTHSLVAIKGEKQATNVADVILDLIATGKVKAEGRVEIGTFKPTWQEIANRCKVSEKCDTLTAGCHRGLALSMCEAYGYNVKGVKVIRLDTDVAAELAMTTNTAHDLVTKLSNEARFYACLDARQKHGWEKETELQKGLNLLRGSAQKFWALTSLVELHSLPVDDVVKASSASKEAIREAAKAPTAIEAGKMLAAIVEGTTAKKPSVLPRPKVEALAEMALSPEIKALLTAIADGKEASATKALIAINGFELIKTETETETETETA